VKLQRIRIEGFRNIPDADLAFGPALNLVHGPNGSGKTSLLEAIYLLATTRSFRSRQMASVVSLGHEALRVFGLFDVEGRTMRVGIERSRTGTLRVRVDGAPIERASRLAADLPTSIISPETLDLVSGTPELRRRALDWGVFHVEPRLRDVWSRLRRALRQRNVLLRRGADAAQLAAWDRTWVPDALEVHGGRCAYLERLRTEPSLRAVCEDLQLELALAPGWSEERDLQDALRAAEERDRRMGHTSVGPHRGDLRLRTRGRAAVELLSRGQCKRFSLQFRLSQIEHLARAAGHRAVVLLDDLRAELDDRTIREVLDTLATMRVQAFLTTLGEPGGLRGSGMDRVFHVEQGRFEAADGAAEAGGARETE
jgi:DNA replication and repair protein RecF